MLTQEPESGMYKDEVSFSYKRQQEPEPKAPSEKLYVGHLPFNVSKRELDDLFGRYGPLSNIEIKHGGYAFIQYENPRDAEDAVRALHNYMLEGKRLTVEFSNKKGTGGNACLVCGQEGHWAK
jgi:arginine/serine-rich splicing factor 7